MESTIGETWRFSTRNRTAQRVFLAVDGPTAASRWIEMQPIAGDPGAWELVTQLPPGRHRLRYFTFDNGTYLNCGTIGLEGRRIGEAQQSVIVDDMSGIAAIA